MPTAAILNGKAGQATRCAKNRSAGPRFRRAALSFPSASGRVLKASVANKTFAVLCTLPPGRGLELGHIPQTVWKYSGVHTFSAKRTGWRPHAALVPTGSPCVAPAVVRCNICSFGRGSRATVSRWTRFIVNSDTCTTTCWLRCPGYVRGVGGTGGEACCENPAQ